MEEIKRAANSDELFRLMEEDETADRIEQQKKATPIEYGRLHGMTPQRIYYFLRSRSTRNGVRLQLELCQCGRKVLDVEQADTFFGLKPEPTDEVDFDMEHPPEVDREVIASMPEATELRELALEQDNDLEECYHAGVECEFNTGADACNCPCNDCEFGDVEPEESSDSVDSMDEMYDRNAEYQQQNVIEA
jgi:hypothetical protein